MRTVMRERGSLTLWILQGQELSYAYTHEEAPFLAASLASGAPGNIFLVSLCILCV
jgi:hypothetical protein